MLKQRFLIQFGSGIFLKILGMASSIVVARIAGPSVIGTIAFGMAFASLFTVITGLWGTPHIKIISEGVSIKQAMGVFIRLKSLTMLLFLVLAFSWAHFFQEVFFNDSFTESQLMVIDVSILAVISHQLVKFGNTTFQARMEQLKANLPDLLKGLTFNIGRVVVVLLGFTAVGLIVWDLISSIVGVAITIYFLRKLPMGKFSSSLAKKYWNYAKPLILFMIVTVSVKYLDKVILKFFTTEEELGYYAVAFSLGGMLLLIKSQIGVIFFPLFAKYISDGSPEKLSRVVNSYIELVLFIIFPVVAGISLAGFPIIDILYGAEYRASAIPFMILIGSSFLTLVGQPFGNIVTGAGKFYHFTWISTIKSLLFFITLYFLLSPRYFGLGAIGLAIAVFFSQIVEISVSQFYAKRMVKVNFWQSKYLYFVVSVLILGLFFWIQINFKFYDSYWSIPYAIAAVALITGFLFFTKTINPELLGHLGQIGSVKKLKSYISKELTKNKDNE